MTLAHSAISTDVSLSLTLFLAGIASFVLICLGGIALTQRRSTSYLLIFFALSTLLIRTAVAGLTMVGIFPEATHHLVEHGLDFVMAGLVLSAVFYARRIQQQTQLE